MYVIQDDFWYQSMMRQDTFLTRWEESVQQMLNAAGEGTVTDRKLRATFGFLQFIQEEVDALSERWVKRKAEIDAEIEALHSK